MYIINGIAIAAANVNKFGCCMEMVFASFLIRVPKAGDACKTYGTAIDPLYSRGYVFFPTSCNGPQDHDLLNGHMGLNGWKTAFMSAAEPQIQQGEQKGDYMGSRTCVDLNVDRRTTNSTR